MLIICKRLFIALFLSASAALSAQATENSKPNIVVMLADDVALMDFSVYGGEARTPNIDRLAGEGALFTGYRTSPLCAPSRAMLLTGMDNHLTGVATIPEVLPAEHEGQPGYSLSLEPGVLTLADHLRPLGYATYMTGKWHLGSGEGDLPGGHGFDRAFALDASGADNWDDKSFMPFYKDAPWFEDGKPADLPEDFYSSKFIVDKMIEYVEGDSDAPFFAFMAFQAIHIPVQAPPEFTANYKGIYDDGWHELRKRRGAQAKSLGLMPNTAPLADMPQASREWDELPEDKKRLYAARMEVNAGMIEAMDHHIGRFIEYLTESGQYENTIFVITSDNGPEYNRGDDDARLEFWMSLNGYHIGLENIGERGSWGFIGPEWASAAAAPSDLFKMYASEGGLRAPMIMSGPGVPRGQRVDGFALVTDIAPTLLELIGETALSADMTGRSQVRAFGGEPVYLETDAIGMEVAGNAALYKGDYKITRNVAPYGDFTWRLYNLAVDPGETTDLATAEPEVFAELLEDYEAYTDKMGVLTMPEGFDQLKQIAQNTQARLIENYGTQLAIAALGFIVLLGLLGVGVWRLFRRA